ncbi:MAG TPA: polysaccharide pyruvyl transferase family protein [Thermoanaerobaculia bacterium]|nr:polysaccharide pyruvyl transferase family protein [Thermoanaerobaculia bacterium]
MERSVLVTGYYGFGNTGDEAILTALVAGLRARDASIRVLATSGDPGLTRQKHGVEAVPWRDPLSLSEAVRRSDLVVIGGGGLFQDYGGVEAGTLLTPRHGGVTFYAGPAVLAAAARKPVALHGLGFGPLASPEGRRIVRAVAASAVRVSVRDAGSRSLLGEIGAPVENVTVSADPAFLLSSAHVRPEDVLIGMGIEPRSPIVGVALRPWTQGVDPARWEAAVATALDRLVERTGATLLFVPFERSPWSDDDDFAVASRVRRRLAHGDRAAILSGLLAPPDTASLLGGCDVVLAMRLHAAVFALAAGVPPVALAYDPKVDALLAGSGLAELAVPLSGLDAADLAARLERAHAERGRLAKAIAASAVKQRRLAGEDLDALAALIADPPAAPPVAPEMLALLDDGLAANLQRTHELSAETAMLRADKIAQDLRVGDLEARLAEAEGARASHDALLTRFEEAVGAHRREIELLEGQRVEAREELYRIQTSRLWRTVNLYWRARRAAARLTRPARRRIKGALGSAPSDWVGPDTGRAEAAAAKRPEVENRCEIVLLPFSEAFAAQARRLAAVGHRVFAVDPSLRGSGPAFEATEAAPRFFTVTLRAPDPASEQAFDALDRLRRELSLGATLAVAGDPAWKPAAARLAARRGWALADTLGDDAAIAGAFPKLSVVVVTWNGLEFNRLCLDSLSARTEWPNLEIVVVDNASADGTRELLEESIRKDPRIRAILLPENRGFAAACNEGLAASTGDFLVILNNDTVVTRGWASALCRHLATDPKLGLVGPVTNAIANAAKVDVGYASVDGLPAWAADWARSHDREAFDIPVLALFCTAMTRRVYAEIGPLDERFGIGLFEDDDYSRRVREKGYAVRCARDAFVHHWQMASFRTLTREAYFALYAENKRRYEEKWDAAPAAPAARPGPAAPTRRFATLEEHRAQLSHVLARIAGSKGAVVFLPSVGWGIHLFQRPHHLARVFARLGHVAIFDSSNAADRVDGFREIEPNLFLFSGSPELLHEIPSPLLWTFPYNFHLADGYPKPARTVYDWIDDLSVFPQDPALLERNHARALSEATLVASVARRLHEEARTVREDALYLPNGVEYERFAAPAAPPRDEKLLSFLTPGAPVAGYYGALAEWFDYPLVDAVAAAKPDWRFVLLGPQYDKSLPGQPMLQRKNVLWLGPRDYVTLPGYLSLFDVATIPFRINAITQATSPLKLYEYFAGARPVVTTPMSECQAHPEVRIAATAGDFAAALDAAREQGRDPDFRARLRSVARENSWSARVMAALRALDAR